MQQNILITFILTKINRKVISTDYSHFEKAWGEFNSICNQVETHFKNFQECALLKKESKNHVPFNVHTNYPLDPSQIPNDTITFNQYVNLVKNQTNYAKAIQDILLEGAKRISQMDTGPAQQQQQQGMHLQQQQQYNQQPMINNPMNNSQMNNQQPMMMQNQPNYQMNANPQMQQQMIQRGGQMNANLNNQMNQQMNQMQMQQQPMMQRQPMQQIPQQIPPQQIPPQQMGGQIKQQYLPHNQM